MEISRCIERSVPCLKNTTYYVARANEERRLAMASPNPKVRAVHLEMAVRYGVLMDADPERVSEIELAASVQQHFRVLAETLEQRRGGDDLKSRRLHSASVAARMGQRLAEHLVTALAASP